MGISYPEPRRYSPLYNRKSDPNYANSYNTTSGMSATNATTRIWAYRIYPNVQGAISKYAIHTDATAFAQSAGTGAIKAAIYQVDASGMPTTKLKNSDAAANIATGTYTSTVFTPSANVELPNPLEPLLMCWVTNLNTVTITNGGTFLTSVPLNLINFHPYAPNHLDLEISVPAITYSSFTFADDFSTHGPTLFTPRNNASMPNIDWYLAIVK